MNITLHETMGKKYILTSILHFGPGAIFYFSLPCFSLISMYYLYNNYLK